jgi:hypothetical protein
MLGKKLVTAAVGAALVLTSIVTIGESAAFASGPSSEVILDGVDITVSADTLPQTDFVAANPGDESQSATAETDNPYNSISLTSVPFGYDDPVETLGAADASSVSTWLSELSTLRITTQGGTSEGTPTALVFGQSVVGIEIRPAATVMGERRQRRQTRPRQLPNPHALVPGADPLSTTAPRPGRQ